MSINLNVYEVMFRPIKTEKEKDNVVGRGESKSITLLASSYEDAKREVMRKNKMETEVEHIKHLADIQAITGNVMDFLLMQSCESYRQQKEAKYNKMEQAYKKYPSNVIIEDDEKSYKVW